MVNAPVSLQRIGMAVLVVVAAGVAGPAAAQEDRDLFAAARGLEQSARSTIEDPNAAPEPSLDDIHTAVAAYLVVPKRFPSSGYSDDALWRAGRLSLDAYARFGKTGDRDAGQRLLKRLAASYPTSKLAKQVAAALQEQPVSGATQAAAVHPAPASPGPQPQTGGAVLPGPAQAPASSAAKPAATTARNRASGPVTTIRSIKRTVLPDVVRVVIELDSEVAFHEERIAGPERIFLDLSPARAIPALLDQTLRFNSDADVVRQVRLGRHENRTTRVVLDAGGVGTYSVYAMYNPFRLVIDCTRGPAPAPPPALLAAKHLSPQWGRQLPSVSAVNAAALREASAAVRREASAAAVREAAARDAALRETAAREAAPLSPPRVAAAAVAPPATPVAVAPAPTAARPIVGPPLPGPPAVVSADLPGTQAVITRAPEPVPAPSAVPLPALAARPVTQVWLRKPLAALSPRSTAAIRDAVTSLPPPAEAGSPLGPGTVAPEQLPGSAPPVALSPAVDAGAKAPEKNSNGGFSIARQLGLGVSRIVIDPGHGGHDPGAAGKDVGEAELVLDVALRLEKLLQRIPGIDVVLTRRTDEFVSLQERTAIANREGADLFLSIHANASESPFARGVETYFLNFANNLGAAAVAARENAASGQAMASLPDLVKMIALNNKLDESRDLATMVQQAMVERLRGVNKSLKDLGVKQAPFAVLIGAAMPSVLVEVSFVTNAQDARQLRSMVYRQRIAEALANAVRKYQTSLKSVTTVAAGVQ